MAKKTRGLLAVLFGLMLALGVALGATPHEAMAETGPTYTIVVKDGYTKTEIFRKECASLPADCSLPGGEAGWTNFKKFKGDATYGGDNTVVSAVSASSDLAYLNFTVNSTGEEGSMYGQYVDNNWNTVSFDFSVSCTQVTDVTLNPAAAQTVDVGGKVSFTAAIVPSNADNQKVKWSVNNSNVALYANEDCTTAVGTDATDILTVYAKGESAGTATITVISDDNSEASATCDVTVRAAPDPEGVGESFTTNQEGVVEYVGTHFKISGDKGAVDSDGLTVNREHPVTVSSLNGERIIRIEATIGYMWGEGSSLAVDQGTLSPFDYVDGRCSVNISVANVNATSVTFTQPKYGGHVQIKSWTIYYKPGQSIAAEDVVATYGDTDVVVSASVTDPTTGSGDISYAVTSGSDVVAVDATTGALTILKAGTATVTVTAAETDDYAETTEDVTVTVNKAANPATVTTTASVPVGGKTVELSWKVNRNGATGEVSYAIDGEDKGCTLDGSELTSGDSTGSVTVNVTVAADDNYEALAATPITVTVTEAISLNRSFAPLAVDGTVALTADIIPADAPNKKVIWSANGGSVKLYTDESCNNEVGTGAVENLTVYAKAMSLGNSDVTVTYNANNSVTAKCSVLVGYGVTLSGGANAALGLINDEGKSYGSDYLNTPGGIGYLLTDLSGIFTVVYTANSGYQFPEASDYYTTTSGVTVTRTSATQLSITGTPSKDVTVTVPDAFHTHDFTYATSGATITAGCPITGCPLTGDPTLTIAAPTMTTYGETGDGISASATLDGTEEFKEATGLVVSAGSITYYKATKNGDAYTKTGSLLDGAPTAAGDYVAEIKLSGVKTGADTTGDVTAFVGYTIAKANAEIANLPTCKATYGQTLGDVSLVNPETNTRGTWAWADSKADVGTVGSRFFPANFTPADTDNYNFMGNILVPVTVRKSASPATVSPTAAVKRGGKTVDLKDNVKLNKGATGDVTYQISGDTNGCTLSGSVLTSGDATGDVTVSVSVAGDDNYEALVATPITVTVTDKDTQTITATDVSATYGDTGKKVSAETSGDGKIGYAVKDGGDVVDVDATTGAITIKKAGRATVTVTASETDSYEKTTEDVAVTVGKAKVTVRAKDRAILVGDAVPALGAGSYDVTGLVGEDELATGPTLAYQRDGEAVTPDSSQAGTYDIVASGADAGENYGVAYEKGTLTISDKAAQAITAEDVTATVGDTGKRVSATTDGDGTLSYAVTSGSDVVDVDATTGALTIKKAGKATVTVTASETSTYAAATKDVAVTVSERQEPEPEPAPASYSCATGTASAWAEGSDSTLTFVFKRSEGDEETFGRFRSASVDGKELVSDRDYTATSGSVVIALQPSFLSTLAAGEHTLTATFDDGDAEAKFTVKDAEPTPAATATLTFDANGGTGTMDKVTAEKGSELTLPANQFKRDGYTFSGWNTQANGKGTSFSDKGTVTLNGDATLYAQWTKNTSKNDNTTPSKSDSTTPSKRSSLPSTGDPLSLAAIAAIAAAGAGAILAGRRHHG